jgi:septum formation protein
LRIPFDVVAPDFEEVEGTSPLDRATGKARSVDGGSRPVLGVDTEVLFEGELLGKPADATEAEQMLEALSGRTHEVVSGLCLRTAAWEELHEETTHVTFRTLTPRDLAHYVAAEEWVGRAGAYAIQGLGASLVERVEGDFLNVVGLPGSLLVRLRRCVRLRVRGRWRSEVALRLTARNPSEKRRERPTFDDLVALQADPITLDHISVTESIEPEDGVRTIPAKQHDAFVVRRALQLV